MNNRNDQYGKVSKNMFEMIQTMRRVGRNQTKSQQGIHHGRGHVLGVLIDNNNIAQRELADLMDIRPASLTDLLEKLEKDGLVNRIRDDNDRRIIRVTITDHGRQIVKQNMKARRQMEDWMFGSLSKNEIDSLQAIMQKMTSSLKQQCD